MANNDIERVRVINSATIEVNLDAPPESPFEDIEIVEHKGGGWVRIEKKNDGLYVAGKKVALHLSGHQSQNSHQSIPGSYLREEIAGLPVLNDNICVALFQYPHLVPDEWKVDEHGRARLILFWGTIYRFVSTETLFVCCLSCDGETWRMGEGWLNFRFTDDCPAAIVS